MNYGSLADADAYFAERLNTAVWSNTVPDTKAVALTHATSLIDRLNFVGSKASAGQALQFPRGTDTTVPKSIEYATYEIAFALLSGIDPQEELRNLSAVAQGFDAARTTYDRSAIPEYVRAGIPSSIAWDYIRPYLTDPWAISLSRV